MASTNQYLEFVLDLLGELDDVAHRKMMGEYVLYYRGKVVGGIYDDPCPAPRAPPPTRERRRCSSSRWRTATRCTTSSTRCGRNCPHRRKRRSRREPRIQPSGLVQRRVVPGLVNERGRGRFRVLPDGRGVVAQRAETNSARCFACSRERSTMSARAASSVRFA